MTTLKTLTAAILITLSFSAFASDEPLNYKHQIDYTVQTYVDAVAHGKIKNLSEVLDKDVKYTFTLRERILNFGKSDFVEFMKRNENVVQNCTTETNIIEQNATQSIVKVTMKYGSFCKINYVSITNTTKGWKITNITSTFI